MTKILNLDALVKPEARELVLGGVSYEVPDMTVENFVATARIAQALAANAEATVADQIDAAVDMIVRSIPGVPRDVLVKCSLAQLNTITDFIRGEDVAKAETAAAEQAAAPAGETPSGN
jgi:uncharacterized protein (DUF2126 family)